MRPSRSSASRPATRTRCSASPAATACSCCAARLELRCRRPHTTWRASSGCYARSTGTRRCPSPSPSRAASIARCWACPSISWLRSTAWSCGSSYRRRSRAIPIRRARARTRSSTRWPAFTRSTGSTAVSPTSAGPTAISSARSRAGSASWRSTRRVRCPMSTPPAAGSGDTRRPCKHRRSSTATTSSTT